jgi:hypothetical protein
VAHVVRSNGQKETKAPFDSPDHRSRVGTNNALADASPYSALLGVGIAHTQNAYERSRRDVYPARRRVARAECAVRVLVLDDERVGRSEATSTQELGQPVPKSKSSWSTARPLAPTPTLLGARYGDQVGARWSGSEIGGSSSFFRAGFGRYPSRSAYARSSWFQYSFEWV